jgi:hypothetical protein
MKRFLWNIKFAYRFYKSWRNSDEALVPDQLDKYFENVVPHVENSQMHTWVGVGDRFIYSVLNEYGNEAGNITYLAEGGWRFFVDNYPSPKKYYSTNLPIKTLKQFTDVMHRTGLKLMPTNTNG